MDKHEQALNRLYDMGHRAGAIATQRRIIESLDLFKKDLIALGVDNEKAESILINFRTRLDQMELPTVNSNKRTHSEKFKNLSSPD